MTGKRKIHKKLDIPPKSMQISSVECGVEYPTVTTDNWRDVTCQKCLEKTEKTDKTDKTEVRHQVV